MAKDATFLQYFPDKYPKDKGPPREYFFDILNTVHPEYLKQVIQHADEERYAAWGTDQKAQTIKVSQYWQEELDSMPYLSCKSFRISSDQQKSWRGDGVQLASVDSSLLYSQSAKSTPTPLPPTPKLLFWAARPYLSTSIASVA